LDFIRYMAENLSALEYKTQEEVLTVIRHITAVLSVSGVQIVDVLQHSIGNPSMVCDTSQPSPVTPRPEISADFSRSSVCIAMLLILKAYLKQTYGLSEEKCMKWVVGKKSALGDKAAIRRGVTGMTWERLPYAVQPIHTRDDMENQHRQMLSLWEQEGVSPEPTEDVE